VVQIISRQSKCHDQPTFCKGSQRELTKPATFFIMAAGFEFSPFTSAVHSCFKADIFLSLSTSTRIISALNPSIPRE
jgi:hypothetical protein